MRYLCCLVVALLAVLLLPLGGCSDTPDEVKDAAMEAAVEMDGGAVDQTGEGTAEAGVAEEAGAAEASTPEDATVENEVDAGQGG